MDFTISDGDLHRYRLRSGGACHDSELQATIQKVGFTNLQDFNNLLIVIMVITALLYSFFSVHHDGVIGKAATFGIWVIMVGFGASFGYTVMARISLLIGRIQFVLGDWLHLLN